MSLGYLNIERIALQYVLEDENWRDFVLWVGRYANTEDAMKWALRPEPGKDELRRLYIAHNHPPGFMVSMSSPPGTGAEVFEFQIPPE